MSRGLSHTFTNTRLPPSACRAVRLTLPQATGGRPTFYSDDRAQRFCVVDTDHLTFLSDRPYDYRSSYKLTAGLWARHDPRRSLKPCGFLAPAALQSGERDVSELHHQVSNSMRSQNSTWRLKPCSPNLNSFSAPL